MQKVDDWRELASVMAHYTIDDCEKKKKAWEMLCMLFEDPPLDDTLFCID
jgi:hypothetical protein